MVPLRPKIGTTSSTYSFCIGPSAWQGWLPPRVLRHAGCQKTLLHDQPEFTVVRSRLTLAPFMLFPYFSSPVILSSIPLITAKQLAWIAGCRACRQALLNHVMEEGTGCPAALAILYTEICARLGLPLHIHSLDKGSYFVVWPQGSLRPCLDGQAIVFDTYSQGCAFLAKEVDPSTWILDRGQAFVFNAHSQGCAFLAKEECAA